MSQSVSIEEQSQVLIAELHNRGSQGIVIYDVLRDIYSAFIREQKEELGMERTRELESEILKESFKPYLHATVSWVRNCINAGDASAKVTAGLLLKMQEILDSI